MAAPVLICVLFHQRICIDLVSLVAAPLLCSVAKLWLNSVLPYFVIFHFCWGKAFPMVWKDMMDNLEIATELLPDEALESSSDRITSFQSFCQMLMLCVQFHDHENGLHKPE